MTTMARAMFDPVLEMKNVKAVIREDPDGVFASSQNGSPARSTRDSRLITSPVARKEKNSMKLLGLCIMAASSVATVTYAAEPAIPSKLSSADIDRMVASPRQGAAMATVPTGKNGPRVLVLRRTQTGEAEVHEAFDDVFVVRTGRASVRIGGTVAGNRQTASGEWRGGTLTGGDLIEVASGDVLWIPAGLPHQVIVPAGGDFIYLALKHKR